MSKDIPMKGYRTTVRLYSGNTFSLLDPQEYNYHLADIAHHLSQANRYNGACPWPYSVARHCMHVASVLPEDLKFAGLLHDAQEAVLGDVIRPLKVLMDDYKDIEGRHQAVVEKAYGLEDGSLSRPEVREADNQVMAREMESVLGWDDIFEYPLAPVEIRETSWKEDRLAYVAAACLMAMPEKHRSTCLDPEEEEIWIPAGFLEIDFDGFDPDAIKRCYQNAVDGKICPLGKNGGPHLAAWNDALALYDRSEPMDHYPRLTL